MAEITYRILPPDEYHLLSDHPFLAGLSLPAPESGRVVVAESEGRIVGFQVLVAVMHLEPIWVDPAYRSTGVARKLFTTATECLDQFHTSVAFCFSDKDKIAEYLDRMGLIRLPVSVHLFDPHLKVPLPSKD